MTVLLSGTLVVWRWGFLLRLVWIDTALAWNRRSVKCSINLV